MKASFWHEWRGAMDGRPVLWVRHVLRGFGCRVDIHKMVAADDAACFHTHPARAIRIILWGGYVEETIDGYLRRWRPGMAGVVRPDFCHRVAELSNGRASYSLWIRFRKTAKVHLRGEGWARQPQTYRDPNTAIEGEAV